MTFFKRLSRTLAVSAGLACAGLAGAGTASAEEIQFYWNSAGPIAGKSCIQLYEGATNSWHDNYLCTDRDYGLRWVGDGNRPANMDCTPVKEGAGGAAWNDNYLCAPRNFPWHLRFAEWGRLGGYKCKLIPEGAGGWAWLDNSICTRPKYGTVGMNRYFFRRDYWKKTAHGKSILAMADDSDVMGDIAFSALNDSLSLAASSALAAGSGGAIGADPVSGAAIGSAVGKVTDAFRDKDGRLPRLAKFTNHPATYLQMDNGNWCRIENGAELAHIERDALEPMDRYDIPPGSNAKTCNSPDGYYEDNRGTVYRMYSSSASNDSWYGIGFGDSYCAFPDPDKWLYFAWYDFLRDDGQWDDIRQSTKFKLNSGIEAANRGRTYRGVCGEPDENMSTYVDVSYNPPETYRNILFNDHYSTSGPGAALMMRARAGNPLGDAMTSSAANFMAGVAAQHFEEAGKKAVGKGLAFYGTATTVLSAFTSSNTSLPQMAKRRTSDAVYLQFDSGQWCFMKHAEMLSIMKADEIEVDVTNNIPTSITPETVKPCGWPDGFYKTSNNALVYYLYSTSADDPIWYDVGFGTRYCEVQNEPQWRDLLERAGANRNAPQESLHRISDTKFLEHRTKAPSCPTSMRMGVAQN